MTLYLQTVWLIARNSHTGSVAANNSQIAKIAAQISQVVQLVDSQTHRRITCRLAGLQACILESPENLRSFDKGIKVLSFFKNIFLMNISANQTFERISNIIMVGFLQNCIKILH